MLCYAMLCYAMLCYTIQLVSLVLSQACVITIDIAITITTIARRVAADAGLRVHRLAE